MPPPCLHEVLFVIVPLINVVIPPASEPVPPLHLTPPPLPPEVFLNISGPDIDLPITSVAPYPEKTAPALSPDLLLCIFPE
jgi:hypothetical protein